MAEIEQQEPEKPKKFQKFLKILKISLIVLIGLAILLVGYFAYRLSQKDLFGWRLNFNLNKVETNTYNGFAPNIAFLYPKIFETDLDPDKKYGKGYVAGIKLKTDDRTGCDIRTNGPRLDFSQSEQALTDAIVNPIKERASNFQLVEKSKLNIGGQKSFKVSFSFLDPIGARIRLDQIFTENQGTHFMIICGTGEYQYAFFRKDFQTFYDSINFSGKISDFEINRPWYRTLLQELIFWRK